VLIRRQLYANEEYSSEQKYTSYSQKAIPFQVEGQQGSEGRGGYRPNEQDE
jgi:hypothetical protein